MKRTSDEQETQQDTKKAKVESLGRGMAAGFRPTNALGRPPLPLVLPTNKRVKNKHQMETSTSHLSRLQLCGQ
jgi:hypothetical protein